MNTANVLVANSGGTLTKFLPMIEDCFDKTLETFKVKSISLSPVDVVVVDANYTVIPEMGIGGYSPAQNIVYVSIDPTHDIKEQDLYMTMLHELHHAARWRSPGYGSTLREALLSEGLATLFEEEVTGATPIYAKVAIAQKQINAAKKELDNSHYNHRMWFISGNETIPHWFGYSYGYKLAKDASLRLNKTAAELVNTPISELFPK